MQSTKLPYEAAEAEIVLFAQTDVLTGSGDPDQGEEDEF